MDVRRHEHDGVDVARGRQRPDQFLLEIGRDLEVCVSTSAARPTTLTVSVMAAGPIVVSSGSVCVGASATVLLTVWNPLNSNVTVYVPDGSSDST